jgi:uncharacterized repeat protein (TIGR03837 family)
MHLTNRWDIFCRVIDNYGDIGVCWRLAADLARRGAQVRLWVDDAAALAWMAPEALAGAWSGVRILPWDMASNSDLLDTLQPSDVWIEAFGCEIPLPFLKHALARPQSVDPTAVWLNLEYLSAESFAERSHGLASPVMHGVARGLTKYFYYPGFTLASGGLLREPDLHMRQAAFDRSTWLAAQGIHWHGERLVSLFCYEPSALPALLAQWQQDLRPTRLLVTPGRATAAVRGAMASMGQSASAGGALVIDELVPMRQTDFDHLLWACDLNLVRGEDSVVRALWAGKPFIWQIYAQHDDAHHGKLQAFLDALAVPDALRQAHRAWNGIGDTPLPRLSEELAPWAAWALRARERLWAQSDLVTRLEQFVASKRAGKK